MVKAGTAAIIARVEHGHTWVLIGKKLEGNGAGLWTYPGGHIETTDKSIWDAAERETVEETGVICKCVSPDGIREDLFTVFDEIAPGRREYLTSYVLAKVISSPPEKYRELPGVEPDKCAKWYWTTALELEFMYEKDPKTVSWLHVPEVTKYLHKYRHLIKSSNGPKSA